MFATMVLAAVFAVAAIAKLADRAGAPEAVRAFGVPDELARPLATVLPLAELAVAALLLFPSTARWGALGALALLGTFIIAIGANLSRGRRPACRCFGQVHSAPVGWPTLARNAVLALAAGLVLARARGGAPPSVIQVVSTLSGGHGTAAVVTLLAVGVVATQGWLVLHLMAQQGRLLLRIDVLEATLRSVGLLGTDASRSPVGLPVGTPAPTFELSALTGDRVSLERLRRGGRRVVLLFSDPGCRPCSELMPELGPWARAHADAVSCAVVTHSVTDAYRAQVAAAGLSTVLVQRDREVADAYGATGTPSAVLVETDGTIASDVAMGATAIRDLLARAIAPRSAATGVAVRPQALAVPPSPTALPVGTVVPTFSLPDLDGTAVDTASFRGRTHLLLFWNPDCGFCERMLPELRSWEQREAAGPLALMLISTGTVEQNRALGLQAPILLDPSFAMGAALGATGTPSAVLVDGDGTLLAPIAVGAPHIFTLAASATAGDLAVVGVIA